MQELAQLGGGGHETICASVQEHIADTYLGYGGDTHRHSAGGGGHHFDGDNSRRHSTQLGSGGSIDTESSGTTPVRAPAIATDNGVSATRQVQAPWRIDPDGSVWTCSHPSTRPVTGAGARPSARGNNKKSKRRGARVGLNDGDSGGGFTATTRESLGGGGGGGRRRGRRGGGGCAAPSVSLGAEAASGGLGGNRDAEGQIFGGCDMEDDLDKAQVCDCMVILLSVLGAETCSCGENDYSRCAGRNRSGVLLFQMTRRTL